LTITFFRRNIFFVATDIKGEIKLALTCGRFGFKGRNKVVFMAVSETTKEFLRQV